MNILLLTHNYPENKNDRKDAGIFISDFVEELEKHHKVFVFCPNYNNNQKFGNWSVYNPLNIFKFIKNIIFGTKESLIFVKKNNINYVLSAWAIPSGIYAFFINLQYKIPYGIWFLGSDLNIYSKLPILSLIIKVIATKANNLFANSFALTKIAKAKYGRCIMLPASTKMNNLNIKRIKLDKNKINVLYVGRLEKIKGIDLLVKEAQELDNKFIIRVIGGGTLQKKLDGQADNVKFLGQMNLAKISAYMQASDFLVVPSRNESMPLVIIEAAHFGLPVLASDVGDCKYILNKYKIGQTSVRLNKFKYEYFKKHGKFNNLVNDYSLQKSVKSFLAKIK